MTAQKKGYPALDLFRLIAAVLVVTIHTSPLASYSETADFLLTRGLARVAVPFFFMTSGFFLISRYARDTAKLRKFLRETAKLYGIAICLYLPLNIYNDYFATPYLLPNILKDLVFDGTFYHLWYLPASMLGAAVAHFLVKRADYRKAFVVSGVLYLIGLFGDSYYGISAQIGGVKAFYTLLFQVSDYTRNGIFFAPIFFVLGGYFADKQACIDARRQSREQGGSTGFRRNMFLFALSLVLMLIEALILHHFNLQRHDSMYLFLVPTMYFLFSALIAFRGARLPQIRTFALALYLIHPWAIVLVRMGAKLTKTESIFIENSLLHFAAVCIVSAAISVAVTIFTGKNAGDKATATPRSYIELNLANLTHNVRELKHLMPKGCRLMAVVKTNAYGHGAYEIATHLDKLGVRSFAVATIDEGIALRTYGVRGEILILGQTDARRVRELKKHNLTQTIPDKAYADALCQQNESSGTLKFTKKRPVRVHLKIDTGMRRLGIAASDVANIEEILSAENLDVTGIFTHLSSADSRTPSDIAFTETQIQTFEHLIETLKRDGFTIPKTHIQSTYGLLNYPAVRCDYVRIGIGLCGVPSAPNPVTVQKPNLKPVLSVRAKIVQLRDLSGGECVGYNRSERLTRDSKIAVLAIGYGDGLPRSLSNGNGAAVVGGAVCPIVGRVCMDMTTIDVTDAKNVQTGDFATLIGVNEIERNETNTEVVADKTNSISNELLSRLGARLPVVAK